MDPDMPGSPDVTVVETEVTFSAELELGTGVEAGVEWGVDTDRVVRSSAS